jgi:hypothetical protein
VRRRARVRPKAVWGGDIRLANRGGMRNTQLSQFCSTLTLSRGSSTLEKCSKQNRTAVLSYEVTFRKAGPQ